MNEEQVPASFERETAAYRARLPELLDQAGQYAVISNETIAGIYPDFEAALRVGYSRFGVGKFMVKEIRAEERVETISCGIRLACPA